MGIIPTIVLLLSVIGSVYMCGNPQTTCRSILGDVRQTSVSCRDIENLVSCFERESKGCPEGIRKLTEELISTSKEQYPQCSFNHASQMRSATSLIPALLLAVACVWMGRS